MKAKMHFVVVTSTLALAAGAYAAPQATQSAPSAPAGTMLGAPERVFRLCPWGYTYVPAYCFRHRDKRAVAPNAGEEKLLGTTITAMKLTLVLLLPEGLLEVRQASSSASGTTDQTPTSIASVDPSIETVAPIGSPGDLPS